MKRARVKDIYHLINTMASFETAEDFDNVGLLVGDKEQIVNNILVALDLNDDTLEYALKINAQLVVVHHPLMFLPIQSITTDSYEGRLILKLIKNNISLIAAHTNMDKSPYSASCQLAKMLELKNTSMADEYICVGDLPEPLSANEICLQLEKILSQKVVLRGDEKLIINRLAIAGGSYSEGLHSAIDSGAKAYLTGELRHHHILEANSLGLVLFEGGHFETEYPMVPHLTECLQKDVNALELNVRVFSSRLS